MRSEPAAAWHDPAHPAAVQAAGPMAAPVMAPAILVRFPWRRFGALFWKMALWLSGAVLVAHLLGLS